MQRNFEKEKQPGDVDCVAWFQSKLALLRDVKNANEAYNDIHTAFGELIDSIDQMINLVERDRA